MHFREHGIGAIHHLTHGKTSQGRIRSLSGNEPVLAVTTMMPPPEIGSNQQINFLRPLKPMLLLAAHTAAFVGHEFLLSCPQAYLFIQ